MEVLLIPFKNFLVVWFLYYKKVPTMAWGSYVAPHCVIRPKRIAQNCMSFDEQNIQTL